MFRFKEAVLVIAIALAAWTMIVPPVGMTTVQGMTFGIVLITLAFWGTGLVPGYVASVFLFVTLILTGYPPRQRSSRAFPRLRSGWS